LVDWRIAVNHDHHWTDPVSSKRAVMHKGIDDADDEENDPHPHPTPAVI
jgi:hypothetical protein